MTLPVDRYDHLLSLVDDTAMFEHSLYEIPRRDHGYTVDDAARALVVLCDAPPQADLHCAIGVLLSFVIHAMRPDGRFHNRLGHDRRWRDVVGPDDTHGRAIWALGAAAVRAPRPEWQDAGRSALEAARVPDSSHLRPHAYAALGACAVWRRRPDDEKAAAIIERAAAQFERVPRPWPESRLSYANGRLPDAMLAIGEVLGRHTLIEQGLEALAWLEDVETQGDHYSFTPVGGWEPGEPRPGFDQQPIEAAALSSAAERAWSLTGDRRWHDAVLRAGLWLTGHNDAGAVLYDSATGACRDGLTPNAANENRGAESTLAGLAVLQACRRIGMARPDMERALISHGGDQVPWQATLGLSMTSQERHSEGRRTTAQSGTASRTRTPRGAFLAGRTAQRLPVGVLG